MENFFYNFLHRPVPSRCCPFQPLSDLNKVRSFVIVLLSFSVQLVFICWHLSFHFVFGTFFFHFVSFVPSFSSLQSDFVVGRQLRLYSCNNIDLVHVFYNL